jgi:hypothetical protein
MLHKINASRQQNGHPLYTPGWFARLLKPLTRRCRTPEQRLQRLHWLESECLEAERNGFSYAATFHRRIDQAKGPVQLKLI